MNDKKHTGRVILTYGRSLIALMIAQSLGTRGIEVIGCDDVDLTVLSFSKFVKDNYVYTAASENEEQFIEDLVKLAKKYKPDDNRPYLLIPAFNDARILARHKEHFEDIITIACPDFESINKVNPKDHFARTVKELDIEAPKTWLPENIDDIEAVKEEITFPVFIKPPDDVGGRGISRIENIEELKAEFKELQKRYPGQQILFQEASDGVDYCFCGLFDQGDLKASMVYHNIQKFPNESGAGVVRETVESEIFDKSAQKLMKPLKWHGVVEIDFMWNEDPETTPEMIEVNPRFWAGLDHSIKSNVDFPYLLYQLFTDGKVNADEDIAIGHKTSLPGLSTMATIESLFSTAINFEDLEERWPDIKKQISESDLDKAKNLFANAMKDSFSFDEALKKFQKMRQEIKEAEKISYAQDDPFIGLGALFVLGSLFRHGKLPPEVTR